MHTGYPAGKAVIILVFFQSALCIKDWIDIWLWRSHDARCRCLRICASLFYFIQVIYCIVFIMVGWAWKEWKSILFGAVVKQATTSVQNKYFLVEQLPLSYQNALRYLNWSFCQYHIKMASKRTKILTYFLPNCGLGHFYGPIYRICISSYVCCLQLLLTR